MDSLILRLCHCRFLLDVMSFFLGRLPALLCCSFAAAHQHMQSLPPSAAVGQSHTSWLSWPPRAALHARSSWSHMLHTQYVAPFVTALWLWLFDSGFIQQPQWILLKRSSSLTGSAAWRAPRPTPWYGCGGWKSLYAELRPRLST